MSTSVALNHTWRPGSPPSTAKAPVGVTKLDVTPDGRTMVAIGNFRQVDGASRDQVATLDLSGAAGGAAALEHEPAAGHLQPDRLRHLRPRRRLLPGRQLVRDGQQRRLRPGRARSATPRPAGRPGRPRPTCSPPGWTSRARTRCCRSPSPARRSTSGATSAGSTTRSAPTSPGPAPSRAPASRPSTRSTACRWPGTPGAPRAACGHLGALRDADRALDGQRHQLRRRLPLPPPQDRVLPARRRPAPGRQDRAGPARAGRARAASRRPRRARCSTGSTPVARSCGRSTPARTGRPTTA